MKPKVIVVTGTPGTGKTIVSRWLASQFKFLYIDVKQIIKGEKLYESYDQKNKCYVVEEKKLVLHLKKVIKKTKQNIIFDSHLAHDLPPSVVDLCIVATCPLKALQRRLKARGYTKKKIKDNLDAEIFEVCKIEAEEQGHHVLQVDTARPWKEELAVAIKKLS